MEPWCYRLYSGLYIFMLVAHLWSSNLVLYSSFNFRFQVFGTSPFSGISQQDIFQKILSGKFVYPDEVDSYTDSCRNFISKLLTFDPGDRITADDALEHEWIHGNTASTSNLMEISSSYIDCLKAYNYGNKLQHILMDAIFNESTFGHF